MPKLALALSPRLEILGSGMCLKPTVDDLNLA